MRRTITLSTALAILCAALAFSTLASAEDAQRWLRFQNLAAKVASWVLGEGATQPAQVDQLKEAVDPGGMEQQVQQQPGAKPNGQGTYTLPNGDKYVGEFKDGMFNGQGNLKLANGNEYVGEFKDGKFNGQGHLHVFRRRQVRR